MNSFVRNAINQGMRHAQQQHITVNGEMILRLALACREISIMMGEALAACENGNRILNHRNNYEGLVNTTSNDRLGSATNALEARLRILGEFYLKCATYLENVWNQMSALDEQLANQIFMGFLESFGN